MDIQNKDIKTFVQYEEYKEEDKSIKITRNIEINEAINKYLTLDLNFSF